MTLAATGESGELFITMLLCVPKGLEKSACRQVWMPIFLRVENSFGRLDQGKTFLPHHIKFFAH